MLLCCYAVGAERVVRNAEYSDGAMNVRKRHISKQRGKKMDLDIMRHTISTEIYGSVAYVEIYEGSIDSIPCGPLVALGG